MIVDLFPDKVVETVKEGSPERRIRVRRSRQAQQRVLHVRQSTLSISHRGVAVEADAAEQRGGTGRWEPGPNGELEFIPEPWATPAVADARSRLRELMANDPKLAARWRVPVEYPTDVQR